LNKIEFQKLSLKDIAENGAVTEKGMVMAFVQLQLDHDDKEYRVGIAWLPHIFTGIGPEMPDFLRRSIVTTLRFHADQLESKALDEKIKAVAGKSDGGHA
jgi:hypothetical protein